MLYIACDVTKHLFLSNHLKLLITAGTLIGNGGFGWSRKKHLSIRQQKFQAGLAIKDNYTKKYLITVKYGGGFVILWTIFS